MGKVRLKGELHDGQHPAIIEPELWHRVNALLGQPSAGTRARQLQNALLRGLLFCELCGAPMAPTYTSKAGNRIRYYTCLTAQKRGWKTCPTRTLLARRIETSVLEKIGLGNLGPWEKRCDVQRLKIGERIERITYHGGTGQVLITLRDAAQNQERPRA